MRRGIGCWQAGVAERELWSQLAQTDFTPVAYTATACMASFITADKSLEIAALRVKSPDYTFLLLALQ